jgi:hypothetical protein
VSSPSVELLIHRAPQASRHTKDIAADHCLVGGDLLTRVLARPEKKGFLMKNKNKCT